MLRMLDNSKVPLLIEPSYDRKYIPLGLAKIAGRLSKRKINPIFRRTIPHDIIPDIILMTSLFTYDFQIIKKELLKALSFDIPIILGGVAATLLKDKFIEEIKGGHLFLGYSKILDQEIPDYNMNWFIKEPWHDYSFVFTSRGCSNKCAYCAVWRIEKERWENPNWKNGIGLKKKIMLSDNNLSACSEKHIDEVLLYLASSNKKVLFDNGLDCKWITPALAAKLSKIKFEPSGLRMAFDRIEEDGIFQKAVKILLAAGIKHSLIMAYVLFNFLDTPQEALYRMEECKRLGIRPYPQYYEPLNETGARKSFVGKYWTRTLAVQFRQFYNFGEHRKMNFENYLRLQGNKIMMEDWDKLRYAK